MSNSAQSVKILVVDDQPARLLSYEAVLRDLGHELVQASSGEAALGLLMRDEFALILLDVNMPSMDGFETATLIHQHPRFQETPIIFVTAFHQSDLDRLRAYELGAVDYVFLPVVPSILRSKVGVLVELYQKRRELQVLNESLRATNAELAAANELLRAEHSRERRAAEEALRASEKRLRAILQNTPALIYQTTLDGRFVHANRMFEEVVGRPSEEILDRCARDLFPAETAAALEEHQHQVLERGEPLEFEETLPVHGQPHVYRSVKAPLVDDDGVLRGVVSVSTDVTERMRMLEELQQADRRKDEFLAMLAHELRNPLAPIGAAAQIMRRKEIADLDLRWCRDVIERQTEILTRLVEDLLDISRISYGKINLRKETIEVSHVIARAIESSRHFFEGRRQELRVTLPNAPLFTVGDPLRLSQVVSNLLNNAASYSESGRNIHLSVDEIPREGASDATDIEIRVKDEGMGISPALLPHVFDLFTRGDRTFATTHGGLGVGLALVQRLVALHDGTVSAHSEGPGHGAEFVVRLRACAELPNLYPEPPQRDERPAPRGRRVLVVDDNVDSAVGIAMILRHGGHEVNVAHDGASALEQADVFRPEVALLDVGMPEMDGCELARRIRRLPWGEGAILIAMTGWSQDEARARTAEAGFDLHVVKPVDGPLLERTIADLFAKRLQPS
jgi:PAS domain S-box-containing protein